jgi:rhodanese-related sulfurtransferase
MPSILPKAAMTAKTSDARQTPVPVHEITFDQLDELIESHEDLLMVDVRTEADYNAGHIPGAQLVPLETLEAASDPKSAQCNEELAGSRGGAVLVYCNDGSRSAGAAATLQRLGFTHVYSLAGGLERWRPQGLVIVD